jgi:hypothetical protein
MKLKLAVAFAVLLFAVAVKADEVPAGYGTAYIPDGSVVTSPITYSNNGEPEATFSFSFADGTGTFWDQGPEGAGGTIDFTTPVSALSVDWYGADFVAGDNLGDEYYTPSDYDTPTGTVAFAGPGITSMQWAVPNNTGLAGIESMTYTLDAADPPADPPSVPEPPSLLLLGMGLAALISLKSKA